MTLQYCYIPTVVGKLLAVRENDCLCYLSFPTGSRTIVPKENWKQDETGFDDLRTQLSAYFAKQRQEFDLRIKLIGTDFQKTVWHALQEIPYGKTVSYGTLAHRINRPTASRAVGAANGANPLPIIIPCHRVIGSNNSLTGFGGGLSVKQILLQTEGALPIVDRLF